MNIKRLNATVDPALESALSARFATLDVSAGFDQRLFARLAGEQQRAAAFDRAQALQSAQRRRAAALAADRRAYRESVVTITSTGVAAISLVVATTSLWQRMASWFVEGVSASAASSGLPMLACLVTLAAVGVWLRPRIGMRLV